MRDYFIGLDGDNIFGKDLTGYYIKVHADSAKQAESLFSKFYSKKFVLYPFKLTISSSPPINFYKKGEYAYIDYLGLKINRECW